VTRRALLAALAALVPVSATAATRICFTCLGRGDWVNPKTGRIETCPTCGGSGVIPK
jgi:hypothetical protein